MIPSEWVHDSAQLMCLKCGQVIPLDDSGTSWARAWCHDEWQKAEELAAWVFAKRIHTCTVDLITAREVMKRYRSTHPPMTFEEELDLYQSLINPN